MTSPLPVWSYLATPWGEPLPPPPTPRPKPQPFIFTQGNNLCTYKEQQQRLMVLVVCGSPRLPGPLIVTPGYSGLLGWRTMNRDWMRLTEEVCVSVCVCVGWGVCFTDDTLEIPPTPLLTHLRHQGYEEQSRPI